MANWFQHLVSKATFWDKNDDAQVARSDEEDRKKKQEQQAQASVVRPSNQPTPPNTPGLYPTKPLVKAGSQSDFSQPNKQMFDFTKPLGKPQAQPFGGVVTPTPVKPPAPVQPQPTPQPKPVTQPVAAPVVQKPQPNPVDVRTKAAAYQNPNVQDVNNYYGGDLKVLNEELAKGDHADLHRIEGLMQSLDNRKKELQTFHDERGNSQSFKSARELSGTIKDTRGDWKKQNDSLKQFWDGVGANEKTDFEQYLAEKNGEQPMNRNPNDFSNPNALMLKTPGSWKNGNGMNNVPDFSGDNEKVKETQQRQAVADMAKKYGAISMDQLGNRTIYGELDRFEKANPQEQRKILKDYEEILTDNEKDYTGNPDLKRKAQQAFMTYQTLLDSGKMRSDWHTDLNAVGEGISKLGSALWESPKHVIQSADVVFNQELLGKEDKGATLDKQHASGELSDEEYNKQMNDYARSLEWVPDEKAGLKGRLLVAAGTSADTVATFLPVLSAAKGLKGAYVAERLATEIALEQGISKTAAKVAAKETLEAFAKNAAEGSLKRTMAEEALANAGFSGVGSLRTGEFDPEKTIKETAMGAVIGGTAPAVGAGFGKLLGKFRGATSVAPEAVEDVGRVTDRIAGSAADDALRASYIAPETSSRIAELEKIVDDTNIPSYQKMDARTELNQLNKQADSEMAKAMGVGEDALDRPAYLHKQDIEDVIAKEEDALNAKINDNPSITDEEIATLRSEAQARAVNAINDLNLSRTAATNAPVNIPSPENPVALAKAGDQVSTTADEAILPAKFNPAPLKKVEGSTAATAEAPLQKAEIAPTADAQGNTALVTDAERAQQLAAEGVAPNVGNSPVAASEAQIASEAERTAKAQVSQEAAAPRTRGQAANLISDDQLRADLLENFSKKETLNLADTENAAQARLNSMGDDDLVTAYSQPIKVETPENYLMAVGSIRRLERVGTPEAQAAIQNALDGLASYSSKAGQGLRVTQMLFENMPTSMKADFLIKKVGKAGVEMTDSDRGMLVKLIERADESTTQLRGLEDEVRTMIDNGSVKNLTPEVKQRIGELRSEINAAQAEKELRSGEAWRFFQNQLPKSPIGKRAADLGRTMMLSSASGRAFDLISTTATATDDVLTQGVSNLIGKTLNKATGDAGRFSDTIFSPRKMLQGVREGAGRVVKALKGGEHVEDFMQEARRSTRGDISQGGTGLRKVVRALTEAPTELTRGLREQELYRQGMQEAAQQGLKGGERRAYAELRSLVPSEKQLEQAVDVHMRANMLHNNGTSRFLNGIATSLDSKGHGALAVLVRNQVMPFTSWLGGNINRTLTDKNVLHNVFKIVQGAARSDGQQVIDNLAKLAVNGGEAYAAGMLLTKAGIITDKDANGDSYGGLYFHIGNRYAPVALLGTVSVPIILGNSIQKMMDAHAGGASPMDAFTSGATNGIVNGVQNAGVASVFGGDNTLQTLVNDTAKEGQKDPSERNLNPFLSYAGDVGRQYIPGITGDVNAILDNSGANPTHEAPLTKVKTTNDLTGREKTDVAASEWNKTLAKIPGLSQGLPRNEDGTPAKDLLDRVDKGNRETGKMVEDRQTAETATQEKKRRKEDDIPDTADGIQARVEDGEFGKALQGYEQLLSDQKKDKDVPKSKREETEQDMKRLKVTMDGGYSPDIIKLYSSTSLSEWRAMADPESDEYDPQTAGKLQEYDQKLADAGVSRGKKLTESKFFAKGAKGGKGSGSSKKTMTTDIATNKISFDGFTPMKAQSATNSAPVSAIPTLKKVPDYSRTPKKISTSRGSRT